MITDEKLTQKLIDLDLDVDFKPTDPSEGKNRKGIFITLFVLCVFFLLTSFLGSSYFFLWLIAETGNIALLIILTLII